MGSGAQLSSSLGKISGIFSAALKMAGNRPFCQAGQGNRGKPLSQLI